MLDIQKKALMGIAKRVARVLTATVNGDRMIVLVRVTPLSVYPPDYRALIVQGDVEVASVSVSEGKIHEALKDWRDWFDGLSAGNRSALN